MALNTSNLKALRKSVKLTQEEVAERLNVSRQTVAKWETGESLPDIENCILLSKLYNVTIDDLVRYAKEPEYSNAPKGKHVFGVVKMDKKRQIVIPEKACAVFDIEPGDKLLILGDEQQGMAMVKLNGFLAATAEIMKIIQETDPDSENQ